MNLTQIQLADIAASYDLKFGHKIAYASGYRNASHMFRTVDGAAYNFILYKDEPSIVERIKAIHRLGSFLADSSLPVRIPVDDRVTCLKTRDGVRYGGIYNYLSGRTIAWEMYSMKHIKLLGYATGLLHSALANYVDEKLPSIHTVARQQWKAMDEYFSRTDVTNAMADKLGVRIEQRALLRLRKVLDEARLCSVEQPLHLDLVRGNLLFGDATEDSVLAINQVAVTGILDFEKAAIGPVVFDIARSLSFLYVDCDKSEEKSKKYFIDSGYVKRAGQAITNDNIELLEPLVNFYLMYDFYKFLSQNPYESLTDNHHYRRTKAILLTRQLLY